jgi:CheY-like chemotaxis protein
MDATFNILLADDSIDDVFLLRQAFKKAGVAGNLITVVDGVEAVAYLRGENPYQDRAVHPLPQILLLDLNMPRKNGFEVLEWMRQASEWRCLMVHVLSASSREADIRRVYELGANSYILKPSRMDELVDLAHALHRWHHFVSAPPALEGARA